MSNDEGFILMTCMGWSGFAWYRWYSGLFGINSIFKKDGWSIWHGLLPIVTVLPMVFVLSTYASFDVTNRPTYIFLYVIVGLAWIGIGIEALAIHDIRWRDDVLELHNRAASITLSGYLLGLSAVYCGANIGDGPGWWCVIWASLLGSAALVLALWFLAVIAGVSERITVERDIGCSVRIAAFAIAGGIICGRGAAGDWTSARQTVLEFSAAWPLILLLLLAIVIELGMAKKIKTQKSAGFSNFIIGLFYLVFAIYAVHTSSPLPQNPIYPS